MSHSHIEFPTLPGGGIVSPLKRLWPAIDMHSMAGLMVVATLVGLGTGA